MGCDVTSDYLSGVDIIGDKTKVIIRNTSDNSSSYFDHVKFYDLVFETASDFPQGTYSNTDNRFTVFFDHNQDMYFKFHNCVFSDPDNRIKSDSYYFAFDWSTDNSPRYQSEYSNFENCVFPDGGYSTPIQMYKNSTTPNILLKNCATKHGSFYSVYSSSYEEPTIETSLTGATFDTEFNITSSGWVDSGTGTDADDGTQTDIGVYGGDYDWDLIQ
ncbi:MAG: hypothetical protein ACOCUF_01920 [Patescibacteria group bacterium]